MMRILITGARAPASLDLARCFALAGHCVFVADSMRFPLARSSNLVQACLTYGPPKQNTARFIRDLIGLVQHNRIDLLIPTCEEIFYIARFKSALGCDVFCDHFENLASLHDKYRFSRLAQANDIGVPETHLLVGQADVEPFYDSASDWVFKPVYSRFGAFTILDATTAQLRALNPSCERPWVAQKRIYGRELCSYGVAYHGKLRAMACYEPLYRLSQSSGVYFEPVAHEQAFQFMRTFVARNQFHGQIGFDFIESSPGQLWVLECNPRVTSGVHLFDTSKDLSLAFFEGCTQICPQNPRPKMLSPVMLAYCLPRALVQRQLRAFLRDYRRADEAGHMSADFKPSLFRFLGFAELFLQSLRLGVSLREAATADIAWDGENL